MESIENQLGQFPFRHDITVQWGEMDAAQHVNNTTYLRWGETARIEFFKHINLGVSPKGEEVGVILGWLDCKYIFPMTYPDTAKMGFKITEIGSDFFYAETYIFSSKHNRIAAISKAKIVAFNYAAQKKVPLPDQIKEELLKYQMH